MSSSSTSTSINGPSRGSAPTPAIFPNVITSPGSPPGNQPPVPNTIVDAFNKQRTTREKAQKLAELHASTRQRILQFLAPPAAFQDPLRAMPVDQLVALSDTELVYQALQLLPADNPDGNVQTADGSAVVMKQCIHEFAANSKSREGPRIRKQLKEESEELLAIADVQRFTNAQDDGDDIDAFLDDDFADEGSGDVEDPDDAPSFSGKRKLQTTLAGATVGKQYRSSGKRQHKPTNRFGINVAQKDKQVLYATENRTLQRNRQLLMVPGTHSKQVSQQMSVPPSADTRFQSDVPSVPLFPTHALLGTLSMPQSDVATQPSANLSAPILPTVVVPPISNIADVIRQQNKVAADVATSMSAAPFAVLNSNGGDGNGNSYDADSASVHSSSDYGSDDQNSVSPSVKSDYDDANENDIRPVFYGHHSDLFENLFQTLPIDDNGYRAPGSNLNGRFGPLLFSDSNHSPANTALLPHVDDATFLSADDQVSTFEEHARLLYINWSVIHNVASVLEIKTWLESLPKDDHLLLVHLYAAYWVVPPDTALSFGSTKAKFWNAINHAGVFINGVFAVNHDVPLVSVTVESLLVRSVGQLVQFLSRYQLTVAHIWDVSLDDVLHFATLDSTVHPRYDVLIAALIQLVTYCSDAYRLDLNIEFMLQRHVLSSESARLNLTTVDANMLLSSYFPSLYPVKDLRDSDGLHLLRRALAFALTAPTPLQLSSECDQRWLHLLACLLLPMHIDVTSMTNDEKVLALVSVNPPSYTNDTLRSTYPALLR